MMGTVADKWAEVCFDLQGHKQDISHITFSSDCLRLATCSTDCTARLWSFDSSQLQGFFLADSA